MDIPSQSLQLMTSPSSTDGENRNGDVFLPQFYRRNDHDDDDEDDDDDDDDDDGMVMVMVMVTA